MRYHHRSRGIALPAVLVSLMLLSGAAVEIVALGRSASRSATFAVQLSREAWTLQAGLARGLAALLQPADVLNETLQRTGSTNFTFDGQVLELALEVESEKVDVHFGDPELLRQLLTRLLPATSSRAALDRVLEVRQRAVGGDLPFGAPEDILPIVDRFGDDAFRLRRILTVYSGQFGLSSLRQIEKQLIGRQVTDEAPFDGEEDGRILLGMKIHRAAERPTYTLAASLPKRPGRPPLRAEMIVTLDPSGGGKFRYVRNPVITGLGGDLSSSRPLDAVCLRLSCEP